MQKPTHLDLFSGIGGFALAAQWAGFRTIGFCEIDKYCQKVLAKNFLADAECKRNGDKGCGETDCSEEGVQGEMGQQRIRPNAGKRFSPRIIPNIFDLDGRQFASVDLITGGFPCQPFSVAGKRRGAADDRAIWPEMFRVINEARPAWVLGENVPGIIPMELDNVLSDLEGIGYATRSFVIPACAVDARHRRDRLWIIGRRIDVSDSVQPGLQRVPQAGNTRTEYEPQCHDQLAPGLHRGVASEREGFACWEPEPAVCELVNGVSGGLVRYAGRTAYKVPNRIQKLKALGNSIVPQLAHELLREIYRLTMETHCVTNKAMKTQTAVSPLTSNIEKLDHKLDQLFASVQCACGTAKCERRYSDAYDLIIEAKASCFEALDILDSILAHPSKK